MSAALAPIVRFPVIVVVTGIAIGGLQWRVLHRFTRITAMWIVITVVGLAVGFGLTLLVGEADGLLGVLGGSLVHATAVGALHGTIIGVVLGALQSLAIRPYIWAAGWWAGDDARSSGRRGCGGRGGFASDGSPFEIVVTYAPLAYNRFGSRSVSAGPGDLGRR